MNMRSLTSVDGTCTAVLTCEEDTRLIKYRGCFEEKIQEIQLDSEPVEIVAVNLVGHPCVALKYM